MKFKAALLLVLVSFAGASAKADHPTPRPGIIAESVTTGGFAPHATPPYGIRIYSNGAVVSFVGTQFTNVAQLEKVLVSKILTISSDLKAEELTDPNPEKPWCMDAPSTSYSIRNSYGTIEIGRITGCKPFYHSQYNTQYITQLLEGFASLSRYER